MLRARKHFLRRTLLDDLALGHDADTVGDPPHDVEIMRDEEHRHPGLGLEPGEQFQNLRLHGHVQRSCRLVGDEEIRLVGERRGDHDTLPLPAGKLVRIGAKPAFRLADADLGEKLQDSRAEGCAAHAPVQLERLADLLLHGVEWIERGHRLLKDHRDLVAAHIAQGSLVGGEQLLPLEQHRAAGVMRRRVGEELDDRERRDRLAGPRLADERHRLLLIDIEGHAADGMNRRVALAEVHLEVADLEEGVVMTTPCQALGSGFR